MESKIIEIIITVLLVIFAILVLRCEPVIRLSDVYTGQWYTYQIIIRMKDKCDMEYGIRAGMRKFWKIYLKEDKVNGL